MPPRARLALVGAVPWKVVALAGKRISEGRKIENELERRRGIARQQSKILLDEINPMSVGFVEIVWTVDHEVSYRSLQRDWLQPEQEITIASWNRETL